MLSNSGQPPRSAGQSEMGLVRSSNQDAILLDDTAGLWLVADGMGGHAGGAQASQLAGATIHSSVRGGASLRASILAAHYAIRAGQSEYPEVAEMGTTVVAVLEHSESFQIAWVGDSRAYLFDENSGHLQQMTRDHNLAGLMVETGALSRADAARHPRRHVLTDCLGLHGVKEPRIEQIEGQWQSGQLVLLCSDGLSGELTDEEIAVSLADEAELEIKVQRLIERATVAGARDNVSVILIRAPQISKSAERSGWWRWLQRPG